MDYLSQEKTLFLGQFSLNTSADLESEVKVKWRRAASFSSAMLWWLWMHLFQGQTYFCLSCWAIWVRTVEKWKHRNKILAAKSIKKKKTTTMHFHMVQQQGATLRIMPLCDSYSAAVVISEFIDFNTNFTRWVAVSTSSGWAITS